MTIYSCAYLSVCLSVYLCLLRVSYLPLPYSLLCLFLFPSFLCCFCFLFFFFPLFPLFSFFIPLFPLSVQHSFSFLPTPSFPSLLKAYIISALSFSLLFPFLQSNHYLYKLYNHFRHKQNMKRPFQH